VFPVVAILLLLFVTPVALAESIFLQHRIYDPLNLLGAVPALSAPQKGAVQWQIAATHANVFAGGREPHAAGEERLSMDGELSELDMRAQWKMSACYSASFDSRLIAHSPGVMDGFISRWHELFGLPDANRSAILPNQLAYSYTVGSEESSNETANFSSSHTKHETSGAALGDVWLSVQRPSNCTSARPSSHWRVGIKAPVGNSALWASGGQWAMFADWHSLPIEFASRARITSTLGASFSTDWDERFDALSPRAIIGYGAVIVDYQLSPRWQSVMQLDLRSPVFRSRLVELGSWGGQLQVGARAALSARQHVEISFTEDLLVDTAPDVGIRIAFSQTF